MANDDLLRRAKILTHHLQGVVTFARDAWRHNDGSEGDTVLKLCEVAEMFPLVLDVAQRNEEAAGELEALLDKLPEYDAHAAIDGLRHDAQAVTALFGERKCEHCGKPPTCFGSYEGRAYGYACDECCGHGCEDGRCVPVVEELMEPVEHSKERTAAAHEEMLAWANRYIANPELLSELEAYIAKAAKTENELRLFKELAVPENVKRAHRETEHLTLEATFRSFEGTELGEPLFPGLTYPKK